MYRVLLDWRHAVSRRLRGAHADRGAGFVEYAGLLLLIAAIVVAVVSVGVDTMVANAIQEAVQTVIGGG